MSTRAATMSSSYSPATRRPAFLGRLVVTLLFAAAITGMMALFYVHQRNLSRFWMTVFAVLSMGLACGSISRMLFYRRSGFIRFLAVLLDLPAAMFLLGVLTNWHLGIGPLNSWARGIIPQDELIQLGGAFLVAFICLDAWWSPPSRNKEVANAHWLRSREPVPLPPPAPTRQPVQTRENPVERPRANSHLKFMKAEKPRSRSKTAVRESTFPRSSQPVRPRRKGLFNRKPNLQISLYEEHRCPFCLEEVKRNDPRGVKKCEVCNTLHHADCWAITGMCQVPHLNT
ncbi:MAG: hypothetical protein K8S20_08510 [Chloroflexi bacterium]|nr:hypothetical protein [Chloroflexota bacterium]